jgi:hypothetical protein
MDDFRKRLEEFKASMERPRADAVTRAKPATERQKVFDEYLMAQQEAKERLLSELPGRAISGAIPGAVGALAGYAAQYPGMVGDLRDIYETFKPESAPNVPEILRALPTTERLQEFYMPEDASPEMRAGMTGGNAVAIAQGVAAIPGMVKGVAKGAPKVLGNLIDEILAPRVGAAGQRGSVGVRGKVPPGELAHKLAQERAALPVDQGGLGLPKNNTSEQRAEAQNYVDYYHGTQRLDRLLSKPLLDPKRATSGPMPYGTTTKELASSYATQKADTSRIAKDEGDVSNYFQVLPKELGVSGRSPISVERSWNFLSPEQKETVRALAPRVGYENLDEFSGPLIVHPEGVNATLSPNHWDYLMKTEAKGNPLTALRQMWHDSGQLYNNEDELAKIYNLAGYKFPISQENAPWIDAQGVLLGKARMENPINTSDNEYLKSIVPTLRDAFKRDRTQLKYGPDQWGKESRYTPKSWVNELEKDLSEGNESYVWTSIPDKVTEELKKLGHDSILDVSGKGGGSKEPVVIPFDPSQVRSRFAAFDPFRKNAAIAAAMGVAAPDLMAKEKKAGGKVSQDAMNMAVMNQKVQKKADGGLMSDDLVLEERKL